MIEEYANYSLNLSKQPQCLKIFSQFEEPLNNFVFVPAAEMTGDPNEGDLYMINLKSKQDDIKSIYKSFYGVSDFEMFSRLPTNNLIFSAIATEDNKIKLCTLDEEAQMQLVQDLSGHYDYITTLKAHEKKLLLLSLSIDGSLIAWNIDEKSSMIDTFKEPKTKIRSFVWLDENKSTFLTASESGSIKQWDLEDPFKNSHIVLEQKHPITCIKKSLTKDFDVYIGLETGEVLQIDLRKSSETLKVLEIDGSVEKIDINRRGQIAVSSNDKEYFIGDIQNNSIIQRERTKDFISDIKFESSESSSFIISSQNKSIEFISLKPQ